MITRRSYHENKAEYYRRHFPHAGSDGLQLTTEDGSVNVMNAAWGTMQERDSVVLNLTETTQDRTEHQGAGAFTVSIADAAHIVGSRLFRRRVRQ